MKGNNPPRQQVAQQTMTPALEDDIWYFPPIIIGDQPPLFPLPLSSKEKPSRYQPRQQPNKGPGGANRVNRVMPVKATSPLKRDSGTRDIADERPLKKRHVAFHGEGSMRSVQHEVARLKERIEKLAAEAQDISSTLQELLHETAESPEPDTE